MPKLRKVSRSCIGAFSRTSAPARAASSERPWPRRESAAPMRASDRRRARAAPPVPRPRRGDTRLLEKSVDHQPRDRDHHESEGCSEENIIPAEAGHRTQSSHRRTS